MRVTRTESGKDPMTFGRRATVVIGFLALAACGGEEPNAYSGDAGTSMPAPAGADVGASGADATAAPAAPGDTSARTGSHP